MIFSINSFFNLRCDFLKTGRVSKMVGLMAMVTVFGAGFMQAQSPLDDTDHDRFPDIYETQLGGNATNPAITPNTAHANFITVNPAVPTSVPNRTYTTIYAAVNAIPVNAYGIVWIKAGTYPELINISNRHVLLIAELGAGPVILKCPVSGGTNIIGISSGAQDTVLDGLITAKTMNGATQVGSRSLYVGLGNANIGQSVAINNCVFKENSYGAGSGSAIYVQSGTVWVTHSSIVENNSTYGQSIHLESYGKIRLRNSIVWNNFDLAYTELSGANNSSLADRIQVTNSIIRGGQYGANASNPLLRPNIQDISVATSPANNSGAPLDNGSGVALLGASAVDLYGMPRSLLTPDIGAYEYTDTNANGLVDWWETNFFGNLNQLATADFDGDGLSNLQDYFYNLNPTLADTDGDGEGDLMEALNTLDTDGDGMSDGFETQYTFDLNNPNDALEDADGDRVPNVFEDRIGRTDPRNALSKPGESYLVEPAIVTETATIKKKVSTAVIAHANNVNLTWAIIKVKAGAYSDSISLSKDGLLLLADNTSGPVTITSPSANYNTLQIYAKNVVVDGFRITHAKGITGRGVHVEMPIYPANPQCRLVNCQIFENNGGTKGSGLYVKAGILTAAHCTIAGNTSTSRSHGVFLENLATVKLQLIKSIIWNPEPPDYSKYSGTPIQMEAAPSQMLGTPSQNFILGGEWGALSASPQMDPDCNLRSASPAINPAGSVVNSSTPASDIHGEIRDTVPDYGADEFRDTDGDGMPDWWEVAYGSGLSMNPALDADSDGLTNLQEYTFGSLPNTADSDADGATDLQEYTVNSNPRITDTDGDGMDDAYEINNLLNANSIMDALEDPDGDRIPNLFEYSMGKTNPRNKLSRPATSVYVDGSIATETATTKKTITNAINSYSASIPWHIIEVKSGVYAEKVGITNSQGVLLLAEQGIRPVTIKPNAVGYAFGASWSNHVVIDGFRITHAAYSQGNGIGFSGAGILNQFKVVNCQIVGNSPASYYTTPTGAGIYTSYGILTVANTTFANNYSNADGHAIFASSGAKLRLLNNIIWNTPPAGYSTAIRQVGVEPGQLIGDATRNIIKGGELGALSVDPKLDYNYRIHPGSPAINPSGSLPNEGVPNYDFQGEARDAMPDYGPDEIVDTDNDGLVDNWELLYFPSLSTTTASLDTDQDGLTNTWEEYWDFNPTLTDSNSNGQSDLQDAIALTISMFTNLADMDNDGLTLQFELAFGTNDFLVDSNADGLPDGFGSPLISSTNTDQDGDGLTNAQEKLASTDPFKIDTDGDGFNDSVDVYPINALMHLAITPNPADTTPPVITLSVPVDAVKLP